VARKKDGRPRHQQIAAEIRARVMSGELPPGARLPTTLELMSTYDVTNQTVQRTLSVLKEEGFLVGRAGVGVYVREESPIGIQAAAYLPPPDNRELPGWATDAEQRGQQSAVRLLEVAEVRSPAEVAGLWGERVSMRRQVLLLDEEPVELACVYHPLEIARGTPLTHRRRIRDGTARVLTELGYPPVESVDRVSTRLPTTGELELLDLPDNVPVLRTFRIVYTKNQQPVEIQILVKGGNRYELSYRFPYYLKE